MAAFEEKFLNKIILRLRWRNQACVFASSMPRNRRPIYAGINVRANRRILYLPHQAVKIVSIMAAFLIFLGQYDRAAPQNPVERNEACCMASSASTSARRAKSSELRAAAHENRRGWKVQTREVRKLVYGGSAFAPV